MSSGTILWLPRIVALLFTVFISLFAFDVKDEMGQVHMRDLLSHLLPTLFCVLIIIISWKREWIGTLVFFALAIVYAWWASDHVQWILLMGGPMLLLAGLYGFAWVRRKRTLAP